jgi:hypothetical protein
MAWPLLSHQVMSEMMRIEKHSRLRRQSMELLKDLTDLLRGMISSGDEEGVRRLQELIDSIRKPAPTIH